MPRYNSKQARKENQFRCEAWTDGGSRCENIVYKYNIEGHVFCKNHDPTIGVRCQAYTEYDDQCSIRAFDAFEGKMFCHIHHPNMKFQQQLKHNKEILVKL